MTAIERTAYPRFKRSLTTKDLAEVYTPTPAERFLAARSTKGSVAEVGFLVLLKTYQRLGRFILLSEVPVPILEHIARLIDPHLDVSHLLALAMTTCSQAWFRWVLNVLGSSPARAFDGPSLPWGECISRFTQGWELRPTSILKLSRMFSFLLIPPGDFTCLT